MTARRLGFLLSLWSFGFACVHLAWAAGWRAGLPADFAPISDRPWFLAYDIAAGVLMYGAAGVAVLLALGRTTPLLVRATVIGSLLALARGVPALVFDLGSGELTGVGFGADVWFTVAGVLGLALARAARRSVAAAVRDNDAGGRGLRGGGTGAGLGLVAVQPRGHDEAHQAGRDRERQSAG